MSTLTEIGEKIKISRQRISKILEFWAEKEIYSHSIVENPAISGSKTFFCFIKTNPEEPEIISAIMELDNVKSLDGVIGPNSLIVRFKSKSNNEFNSTIDKMDQIISESRFQHYRIIDCLRTYKDGGKMLKKPVSREVILDETDITIIKELNKMKIRKKLSYKVIYDHLVKTNLSYSKFLRKIKKIVNLGIIESFTTKFHPNFIQKTDYGLKFYLQIKPKNFSEYNNIAEGTLNNESIANKIVELYRTGQEFGLLAVVRTGSIKEYRNFIESLYKSKKIQDSNTTIVIDEKLPSIFKPFKTE